MRVRFQIDIERAATRFFTGLFESKYFGVFHSGVGINTGTCDISLCIDNDGTNVWIRRS